MMRVHPPLLRLATLVVALVGCSNSNESGDLAGMSDRCVIQLHGKGDTGGQATIVGGVATLRPSGNDKGWGGRQWLYFPDSKYRNARDIVQRTLDEAGCTAAVIHGFSNGGAFAAKLYCRGETFGGRVVGYVIDDPVTDHGVEPCQPDPTTQAVLYWTGALAEAAPAGASCKPIDWTCEGGAVLGIDAYAAALDLPITPSPFTDHQAYEDAPEIEQWLSST